MKKVANNHYFSLREIGEVEKKYYDKYIETLDFLEEKNKEFFHNVVKINLNKNKVSLLLYYNFNISFHPVLSKSLSVDLSDKTFKKMNYKNNPPILHRLELFLPTWSDRLDKCRKITKKEENKDMYKESNKIGRLNFWNELCDKKEMPKSKTSQNNIPKIDLKRDCSKKTAITRNKLSAPFKYIIDNYALSKDNYIIDYGCGKGVDVEILADKGYNIVGYDKHHNSSDMKDLDWSESDTVVLNYVLNVIPLYSLRVELLNDLKANMKEGAQLFLSVRRENEIVRYAHKKEWDKYQDGFITKSNTFQKGFNENELKNLLSYFFVDVEVKKNGHYLIAKALKSKRK